MIVLASSQIYNLNTEWLAWTEHTRRLALVGGMLAWFPVNMFYVFGSVHLKVKSAWDKHRRFWLYLLAGGVLWTFTILCMAAGRS